MKATRYPLTYTDWLPFSGIMITDDLSVSLSTASYSLVLFLLCSRAPSSPTPLATAGLLQTSGVHC